MIVYDQTEITFMDKDQSLWTPTQLDCVDQKGYPSSSRINFCGPQHNWLHFVDHTGSTFIGKDLSLWAPTQPAILYRPEGSTFVDPNATDYFFSTSQF